MESKEGEGRRREWGEGNRKKSVKKKGSSFFLFCFSDYYTLDICNVTMQSQRLIAVKHHDDGNDNHHHCQHHHICKQKCFLCLMETLSCQNLAVARSETTASEVLRLDKKLM